MRLTCMVVMVMEGGWGREARRVEGGLDSSPRQVPEAFLEAPAMLSTTHGTGPGVVVGKPQASASNGWASVFPSVK